MIMVAVNAVGSADPATCADCIGSSMFRWVGELVRHIIWWYAILICSGCYWAPGTVPNLAIAWFVGCDQSLAVVARQTMETRPQIFKNPQLAARITGLDN